MTEPILRFKIKADEAGVHVFCPVGKIRPALALTFAKELEAAADRSVQAQFSKGIYAFALQGAPPVNTHRIGPGTDSTVETYLEIDECLSPYYARMMAASIRDIVRFLEEGDGMTYDDISPTIRAFIGNRQAFRKMGYRGEDLYLLIAIDKETMQLAAFVHLKAQNKEFDMIVGLIEDEHRMEGEYRRVSVAINGGEVSQEDLERMWQESEACHDKIGLATALAVRGFVCPKELS